MLRRANQGERHSLRYGDIELDLITRRARRPNLEVTLSDREAELLAVLIRRAEEVLTREQILDELWGGDVVESSNLVNVYVNLLRNKIETPWLEPLIHTIRGVGYQLSRGEPDRPNP
jgi:DNA-binding response OmpR family regulator